MRLSDASGYEHTNLKTPLIKRYAGISGQIRKLEHLVEETERVHSTLPEMRADIAQKKDELVHLASILRVIDPAWDPAPVQPRRANAYTLPFKFGECTAMAYDIVRLAARWMTVREVVNQICQQEGVSRDEGLDQRLSANVWAGFTRRLERGELQRDDTLGHQRWRVTPICAAPAAATRRLDLRSAIRRRSDAWRLGSLQTE